MFGNNLWGTKLQTTSTGYTVLKCHPDMPVIVEFISIAGVRCEALHF